MGKNGRLGKSYGKVVRENGHTVSQGRKKTDSKPNVKSAKSSETQVPTDETKDSGSKSEVSLELQQLLLNIFKDSFSEIITSKNLQSLLQDVKGALYDRDFARAFGKSEYLEAYSVRWSPSRALCYVSILVDLRKHLTGAIPVSTQKSLQNEAPEHANVSTAASEFDLHAVCFGGGAAEAVAFGGLARYIRDISQNAGLVAEDEATSVEETMLANLTISGNMSKIDVTLVDVAQWQDVVTKLRGGLTNPPPLSKYASAAARDANSSLIADGAIRTTFRCEDALELTQSQLDELLGARPMLVTLLFTLNELYTTSMGKATAFLLKLTMALKPGSYLLVVDSPGSYSQTSLGAEAKRYPMLWLMDHALLEAQGNKSAGKKALEASWEKILSKDSEWFRIPEDCKYPIALENMRYQIHLYKRT